MESYGEILKKRRLSLGLSLERISKDTAILKEDLEALENEDEGVFSGEPYLVGFLKNFAQYMGLDADNLVSLYKAKKMQEAPVPKELLPTRKPASFWVLIVSLIIFFVLLAGAAVFFFVFHNKTSVAEEKLAVSKGQKTKMYELNDKPLIRRLYKGDQITVPTINGSVVLTVADTTDVLSLDTPLGLQKIELSEEIELDIDGDLKSDIIVYVSDISKGNSDRGAETRLLVQQGGSVAVAVDAGSVTQVADLPQKDYKVIFEDNRAYPFTLSAAFRNPCVLRYQSDRKEKIEEYFSAGDLLTVTSSNGIRLWTSNTQAVKFQVLVGAASYDIEAGIAGEVKVQDVKWVRDSSGKYSMVVIDID